MIWIGTKSKFFLLVPLPCGMHGMLLLADICQLGSEFVAFRVHATWAGSSLFGCLSWSAVIILFFSISLKCHYVFLFLKVTLAPASVPLIHVLSISVKCVFFVSVCVLYLIVIVFCVSVPGVFLVLCLCLSVVVVVVVVQGPGWIAWTLKPCMCLRSRLDSPHSPSLTQKSPTWH